MDKTAVAIGSIIIGVLTILIVYGVFGGWGGVIEWFFCDLADSGHEAICE